MIDAKRGIKKVRLMERNTQKGTKMDKQTKRN